MSSTAATIIRSSCTRPDLLDAHSPAGLKVTQLVNEPGRYFRHLYMEVPKFTPDGHRLVVQEWIGVEQQGASSAREVLRHYYLCDLADSHGITLHRITEHDGLARAAAVDPAGKFVYFLVSRQEEGKASFWRCDLGSLNCEKLLQVDEELKDGLKPW